MTKCKALTGSAVKGLRSLKVIDFGIGWLKDHTRLPTLVNNTTIYFISYLSRTVSELLQHIDQIMVFAVAPPVMGHWGTNLADLTPDGLSLLGDFVTTNLGIRACTRPCPPAEQNFGDAAGFLTGIPLFSSIFPGEPVNSELWDLTSKT